MWRSNKKHALEMKSRDMLRSLLPMRGVVSPQGLDCLNTALAQKEKEAMPETLLKISCIEKATLLKTFFLKQTEECLHLQAAAAHSAGQCQGNNAA
jgi:hypothetical protein